jgi:hypothetical protein
MSADLKTRIRGRVALGAAAAVAVLAITGCGGSSDSSSTAGSGDGTTAAVTGHDPVTESNGSTEIVTAGYPSGRDTDEVSVTGAKPIKTCWLVPKAQADGILGDGVKMTERPLGPTCVYVGSGREVDLTVEAGSTKQLKHGAKRAEAVTVNGRGGYCLTYQSTSVVFDIGSGEVLHVTGPCQAGVRFAAVALPRVPQARR